MRDPAGKPKRKLNALQKAELRDAEVQLFVRQYGRKAQRGVEPNDRRYERDLERRLKHIRPEELDAMLRRGEE